MYISDPEQCFRWLDWNFRRKALGQRASRMGVSMEMAAKKNRGFDPRTFLATIGEGRKTVVVSKRQGVFSQGDAADAVFYILKGKVRLTVVSQTGKEATIGILS